MALVLQVDSKTRVYLKLDVEKLIDELMRYEDAVFDDVNILEEIVEKLSEDSYLLIRPSEKSLSAKKLIINCPMMFRFIRKRESSSGL